MAGEIIIAIIIIWIVWAIYKFLEPFNISRIKNSVGNLEKKHEELKRENVHLKEKLSKEHRYCSKCGKPIKKSAKFCEHCGIKQ